MRETADKKRAGMERVAQIDKDILNGILLSLSKGEKTVTYGELSRTIKRNSGRKIDFHMGLNEPLGRIQDYCTECNAPCLSALVVR